jgi:hypothetical protein
MTATAVLSATMARRFLRGSLLAAAFLVVTACGAGPGGSSGTTSPVDSDVLSVLGAFESAADSEAKVDSASALDRGLAEEFGRPGLPDAYLVRSTGSESDLVRLAKGQLVWIFHWGGLSEEDPQAFPPRDGKPNETVFLHTNYFLVVDASTGQPIAGITT